MDIGNFTVDLNDIEYIGRKLQRPESVLVEKNGNVWIADARGIATLLDANGEQTLYGRVGGQPNGLAMDSKGIIYNANIGDGRVYQMQRNGKAKVFLEEVDGVPLGCPNFVMVDSRDRLWISCSTRKSNWQHAISPPIADGCIIVCDSKGPRIVADGIYFTNEIRLDADERYLYAAETTKSRLLRFEVLDDEGNLGEAEVYGPDGLGFGAYVDGFSFDRAGNIWLTTVFRNGIMVIDTSGNAHTVVEDVMEPELEILVHNLESGSLNEAHMHACMGQHLQFPTCVTFAGHDLQTVLIGSLAMSKLATFRAPVAGLPLSHWRHVPR